MLTEIRWKTEKKLMRQEFPQFKSIVEAPYFGFQGCIEGKRSGTLYEVVLEGDERFYPAYKPAIYISPQIGPHWVMPELYGWKGRRREPQLCADYTNMWKPATSTFGNVLLRVIGYLEKYDE